MTIKHTPATVVSAKKHAVMVRAAVDADLEILRLRADRARLVEALRSAITDLETAYDAAKGRGSNLEVTLGMWRRLNAARALLRELGEDA